MKDFAGTSVTVDTHHLLIGPLDLVVSIGMELPSFITKLSLSWWIVMLAPRTRERCRNGMIVDGDGKIPVHTFEMEFILLY